MTVGWACAFGVLMSTAGSAWMEQQFNPCTLFLDYYNYTLW